MLSRRADIDILGIDQDADAIDAALSRLSEFADRVRTSRRRFNELDEAMAEHGVTEISGALFDLGVSSPQLDRAERGFSYRSEGPIDMRMNSDQQWSAQDVVNGYGSDELERVIKTHGDERFARRIADAIVAARPIATTTELAEVVTTAIPAAARRTGGHPAKRTFQAIRIEVNQELDVLPDALDQAVVATLPGEEWLFCLTTRAKIASLSSASRSLPASVAAPTICPVSAVRSRPCVWSVACRKGPLPTSKRETAGRPVHSCESSRRPSPSRKQ